MALLFSNIGLDINKDPEADFNWGKCTVTSKDVEETTEYICHFTIKVPNTINLEDVETYITNQVTSLLE
jgi:diphthamide synthase subunit DPH2